MDERIYHSTPRAVRDDKINRVWPSIARGSSGSKKGARADAAVRALEQWEEILRRL